MVISGGKCPGRFSIHLYYAVFALVEMGYTTFIYGELGATEQTFLSMLTQIRNTYPDKAITVTQIEPQCDLYETKYAGREYYPDSIRFIEDTGTEDSVEHFLVCNSSAIILCGSVGREKSRALRTTFPVRTEYKSRYIHDIKHALDDHKRMQVHLYEK